MKTVPPASSLLLQEFLECLVWYLEIQVSWMIVKIHLESFLILHINVSTSYAVETKMEAFALAYLAFSQ